MLSDEQPAIALINTLTRWVVADAEIAAPGDWGARFYLINYGRVELSLPIETDAAHSGSILALGSYDFFGDAEAPAEFKAASAFASTPTECFVMPYSLFATWLETEPAARAVLAESNRRRALLSGLPGSEGA